MSGKAANTFTAHLSDAVNADILSGALFTVAASDGYAADETPTAQAAAPTAQL